MPEPQITLTARLSPSALDTRRGVVRLHQEVLDALGLRAWDAVRLVGARVSAALAARAPEDGQHGVLLTDDVTLSNLGVTEGGEVVVSPADVAHARSVTVAGSRMASMSLSPEMLRLALIGKVFTVGDAVSLLPQDLAPPAGTDVADARGRLSRAIGMSWTTELLTITATDPDGPVTVGPSTVLSWRAVSPAPDAVSGTQDAVSGTQDAVSHAQDAVFVTGDRPPEPRTTNTASRTTNTASGTRDTTSEAAPPVADLVGARQVASKLTEWFELAFSHPELLERLGASARLGVLLSGPEGVGKATVVRSVAQANDITVVPLAAPSIAVLEPNAAVARLDEAVASAKSAGGPAALLLTDVDALLPAPEPPPVATVLLDRIRTALRTPNLAVVATTAHPEGVDSRLRSADLLDRELSLSLPTSDVRTELLRVLLRDVPLEPDVDLGAIAAKAPGFVAADLIALRRDAALRAAVRQRQASMPRVAQQDLLDALSTVRPLSMSESDTLATGGLSLDDVGDMHEVKQALTEAVLWPLRYPDSFARLGVTPPRGVLLYGPPGGGKTFLVRALAGTGALNVFAVKGAELMDKWVGESERAVRELFRRAAEAAPSLVFLDEIDALAPRRGQSSDSGVADRVVASLLTELDGVEPLRDVVVLCATNRPDLVDPALLRPGRIERLVYIPPPDAAARAEILRATAQHTPLAPDVDLDAFASTLDGYSAADCAALIREGALTAMRESLAAAAVTAAHLDAARKTVRPSLDPAQLATLEAYAARR